MKTESRRNGAIDRFLRYTACLYRKGHGLNRVRFISFRTKSGNIDVRTGKPTEVRILKHW